MLGLQDPNMLVVSRPSSNNLFPGWGLTKVNIIEGDTFACKIFWLGIRNFKIRSLSKFSGPPGQFFTI